jgi:hypothetical protein
MVVQRVPRQLNAQERAAANKLAAEQAAKQHAAQEIANTETQMLAAYPDEESYKISQQQTLDTIDQQIRTTQINLRSQEKTLTDLLGRAADIENTKDAVPKFLADSIARQRGVVTEQRNTLQSWPVIVNSRRHRRGRLSSGIAGWALTVHRTESWRAI